MHINTLQVDYSLCFISKLNNNKKIINIILLEVINNIKKLNFSQILAYNLIRTI